MALNNLISKVLAGGLAAGIFLFWWPAHFPSTGGEWLVVRGLAWALAYEILMLSFCPLENLATRSMPRPGAADRARQVRGLLTAAPQPAKAGGAVLLACTGLLLPAMMLAHARNPLSKPAPRPVQVVRKVVVRKVVRQKTVVVPPSAVIQTPAPMPTSPPPATSALVAKKQPKATTSKPATKAKRETKKTATKAEPKQDPAPAPTARPTAPAGTTTPPDPVGAAAPSSDAATPTSDAG
jgi:outer membrane biosynthesis protein TonB